ncbi:MAG TPA: hypothetical protein VGO93_28325 [Candidatus Xenobia bacterium]
MSWDSAGVLLVVIALVCTGWGLRSWRLRVRLWWRLRRARQAQVDAEQVLADLGYRVVDKQLSREIVYQVDGEEVTALIRPDLVVERRGAAGRGGGEERSTGTRSRPHSHSPATA